MTFIAKFIRFPAVQVMLKIGEDLIEL